MSAAMSIGRRPCLRRRFAILPAVVVLPEPCSPTSAMTVGGRSERASGTASPPSISTSASWTIFTTICAPVTDSTTRSPIARSRTVATSWRTTLKFTSASRSARRTSRSASSRSPSPTFGRPCSFANVVVRRSESCSNIRVPSPGSSFREDELRDLIGRDLGRVEVPLRDVDAERAQRLLLLDRLDAIGDDARTEATRRLDDRADELRAIRDIAHRVEADLQRRHARRGALRHLIGRQPHPGPRERRDGPIAQAAAGELDLDLRGCRARLLDRGKHRVHALLRVEGLGPHADGRERHFRPALAPPRELEAGRADDPAIERHVERSLAHEIGDIARPDQADARVRPADEGLDAVDPARRETELRQVVKAQAVARDRGAELLGPDLRRAHEVEYVTRARSYRSPLALSWRDTRSRRTSSASGSADSKSRLAPGSAVTRVACVRKSSSTSLRTSSAPASSGPPSHSRKRTPRSCSSASSAARSTSSSPSRTTSAPAWRSADAASSLARYVVATSFAFGIAKNRLSVGNEADPLTTTARGCRSRPFTTGVNGSTRRVPAPDMTASARERRWNMSSRSVRVPISARPRKLARPSAVRTKFRATCGRPSCGGGSRRSRWSASSSSVPAGPRVVSLGTARQHGIDERSRLERDEVVRLLPHAEVADRQLQLVDDREDGAAFRRPIELRDHEPGDRRGLGELARLDDRVLALRAIQHEEHLVRRALARPRGDSDHFAELFHQVPFRMQPARRVGDDDAVATSDGGVDRIEHDCRRVAVRAARHDRHADARGPGLELLDRRGAERVGGREQRCLAGLAKPLR